MYTVQYCMYSMYVNLKVYISTVPGLLPSDQITLTGNNRKILFVLFI